MCLHMCRGKRVCVCLCVCFKLQMELVYLECLENEGEKIIALKWGCVNEIQDVYTMKGWSAV